MHQLAIRITLGRSSQNLQLQSRTSVRRSHGAECDIFARKFNLWDGEGLLEMLFAISWEAV